jgi:hypothetical protein
MTDPWISMPWIPSRFITNTEVETVYCTDQEMNQLIGSHVWHLFPASAEFWKICSMNRRKMPERAPPRRM